MREYGRIRVSQNPYSPIFYAVYGKFKIFIEMWLSMFSSNNLCNLLTTHNETLNDFAPLKNMI